MLYSCNVVRCINSNCRKEIDEQFYYCPYCGTDNRAPENRFEPADHQHQYPAAGAYFCVWCGDQRGKTYLVARPWRKPLLAACISLGLAYLGFLSITSYCTFSGAKSSFFGYGEVCQREVQVYTRHYGYHTSTAGNETIKYTLIIPIGIAGIIFRLSRRGY